VFHAISFYASWNELTRSAILSGAFLPSLETFVNTDLAEVEAFLHRQIPMTLAMGVRLVSHDRRSLVLTAPLSLNHNHLGTAFAGSLNALATLAGYAFLWLELRERPAHVVLRESTISFRRPVTSDLKAICHAPDTAELATFHEEFSRKGKARLKLHVTIEEAGVSAVLFDGTFVAVS
jgi:thioesterase domain-containing protein